MAHQIVATSVPRGLDGVSGYQTVLKSPGIPPRVFDRLKARSGYSHRYPHGDSRNPVIYVHRIEELGGSRWHVLGCIRDAGSDHTGRSNFLAHMLAIDAAEARGKPGGPAAAAMARGCFLENWNRPPDPAAPAKTLVAADRPTQPGDAPAWTAAGLDCGLAGDLAAAAMAGQKVVLVTRPDDDVLALFADSLRLVEPSKRWGVTFNTCAIEDFDGVWKAIRADLGDARDLRDSKTSLIDLTKHARGSTNPYAQFARGESTALPWHKPVASVRPEQEIQESSNKVTPQTEEPSAPRTDPRKAPPKQSGRAATRGSRDRRPRYEEPDSPRVPWRAIAIGTLSLLAIAGLVAIPYRDQILDLIREPDQRSRVPIPNQRTDAPVNPPSTDGKDTPEYRAAQQLTDARKRLAEGLNGTTYAKLRSEADALLDHIEALRLGKGETSPLQVMAQDSADPDPKRGVQEVIDVCADVLNVLEKPRGVDYQKVIETESKFHAAVQRLAALHQQVDELADAERKMLKEQRIAADKDARRARQQQAFSNILSLRKVVSLPTAAVANSTDLDDPNPVDDKHNDKIDLGPFSPADLEEHKFRLALPRDTVDRTEFKADVVQDLGAADPRWDIRYLPSAVGLEQDKQAVRPRILAHLVTVNDRLILDIPRSNELALSPFAMLRRSVLLVEARDPTAADAAAVKQEIRLVEPTQANSLVIDLFAERQQEIRLPSQRGQYGTVKTPDGSVVSLKLPVRSLRFEAEMPDGTMETFELTDDSKDDARLGIKEWRIPLATVPLSKVNPKLSDLGILAVIRLSLPQATITVQTELDGDLAKRFSKDEIKQVFIKFPEKALKKNQARFEAFVKKGKGFEFRSDAISQRSENEKIKEWFGKELVGERSKGWGLVMPGHETIKSSFTMFLKETGPDKRNTFEDFEEDCNQVRTQEQWKAEFLDRVEKWSKWFKPQFETQWHDYVRLFGGTLAETRTLKIIAISSLAFDESGNEYVVPLVIGEVFPQVDQAEMPTETKTTPEPDDAPALADSSVVPTPNSTDKSSVGIE